MLSFRFSVGSRKLYGLSRLWDNSSVLAECGRASLFVIIRSENKD